MKKINIETKILKEPLIEFGYGQSMTNPRNGLSIFGPYDINLTSHPEKINYALIGSNRGINFFSRFTKAWIGPLYTDEKMNASIWPHFPGFEAVFKTKWPLNPVEKIVFDSELVKACEIKELDRRVKAVVDYFIEGIRIISRSDDKKDVIICVVPDYVFQNCRPKSEGWRKSSRKKRKSAVQMDLFSEGEVESDEFEFSTDFRRQLKARSMEFNIPIQIIRESTLSLTVEELGDVKTKLKRGLTPASDRAWNLGTTIFYKAGGKPWKLSNVRDGVCYIGIAYRMTGYDDSGSKSACCAAQMFLQDGEGVIFKGEEGVWHSPADKSFHLRPEAAERLLSGVLKAYKDLGGKPLKEVFLHCASGISEEEYQGFLKACPEGAKLVAVRVKRDRAIRFLRKGNWPVMRGTFWKVNESSCYLWGSGFKPDLATYDGTELPVPMRIDVLKGEAEIEDVAIDILGLTKLNYNACKFSESEPVTIGFSDAVGEILISNPGTKPHPQFKFYI